MAKKEAFRYNTGATKVPWAAVGENYNAEDLFEVVKFLMQGEGEEYEAALAAVKADERFAKLLDGKTTVKEIFVPNKLVNIVVR